MAKTNATNQECKAHVWSLCQLQDSLLQSYRGIFVSTQAILLGLGSVTAILTLNDSARTWWHVAILGVQWWFARSLLRNWELVATEREQDVTFCHWLLQQLEQHHDLKFNAFSEFKHWQANRMIAYSPTVDSGLQPPKWVHAMSPNYSHAPARKLVGRTLIRHFKALWLLVLAAAIISVLATDSPTEQRREAPASKPRSGP